MKKAIPTDLSVILDIKAIILQARDKAIRLVDHERTLMHWNIGKRIFEEEQEGKDRAGYGDYLTKFIAEQLEPEYGSGFSKRLLSYSAVLPHVSNCVYTAFAIGKESRKPAIRILFCAVKIMR